MAENLRQHQPSPADNERFDLSPWVETPSSSRVSRFRYDHANRAIQVQWTNQKNIGYIYEDASYEQYRGFARAVSKGKRINSHLNHFAYRPMTEDEASAPSNPARRGLQSRVLT